MKPEELNTLFIVLVFTFLVLLPVVGVWLGTKRKIIVYRNWKSFHFTTASLYAPPLVGFLVATLLKYFATPQQQKIGYDIILYYGVPIGWLVLIGICVIQTFRENNGFFRAVLALITKYTLSSLAIISVVSIYSPKEKRQTWGNYLAQRFAWLAFLGVILRTVKAVTLEESEELEWFKNKIKETKGEARSHGAKIPDKFKHNRTG